MGSIKKRLIVCLLALGMMITLTGCDLPEDLQQKISNAFRERASLNMDVADRLHNSGIISDTTYDMLSQSITKNLTEYGASIKSADSAAGKNLLKSCVAWRVVPEEVIKEETDPFTETTRSWIDYDESPGSDSFASQYLTNYLVWGAKQPNGDDAITGNVPVLGYNQGQILPIEVISESLVEQLNEELSIPVYVLKTDISDGVGIDGIIEAVKAASDNKSEDGLANYFEAAYYTNDKGEKMRLTLVDPTNPDEQLVRVTSGSSRANDPDNPLLVNHPYTGEYISNALARNAKKDIQPEHTDEIYPSVTKYGDGGDFTTLLNPSSGTEMGFPSTRNQVGTDMVITMASEPIMAVRLIEFNFQAVENLEKKIGLGNSRYLVLNNRAYLVEYPVGYIEGFKESEDRTSYDSIIKQSQLGFNLLTGKFSKFELNSDGSISNNSNEISSEDPYLTFDGALSNTDETKASLVLYGQTGVSEDGVEEDECNPCWNLALGTYTTSSGEEKDRVVSVGRIVLRDYLEATYAPGVVSGETMVVLGRKLRVLNLSGTKENRVAQFYDKEGNVLEGSADLFIDDFADFDMLTSSSPKVGYISKIQETLDATVEGSTDTSDTSTDTSTDTDTDDEDTSTDDSGSTSTSDIIKSSISKIDKLPTTIVSQISCSTPFPGKYIGYSDMSFTDDKPFFYAMVVKKSMFETGLFSGWVQSTDSEKNSILWWNDWLGEHGFNYKINSDSLVTFLKGNYAYELSQSGIIILDLETIAKIQQEYVAEQQLETGRGLRTAFIILGYGLIAYAMILMIAWNVDVNVDLGFNILEKVSFGRWIAVKDYEELPYMNTDETNYIRFGQLLVACIWIITLGIILILVNILDLVLMMIELFGGIAEYASRIITGAK